MHSCAALSPPHARTRVCRSWLLCCRCVVSPDTPPRIAVAIARRSMLVRVCPRAPHEPCFTARAARSWQRIVLCRRLCICLSSLVLLRALCPRAADVPTSRSFTAAWLGALVLPTRCHIVFPCFLAPSCAIVLRVYPVTATVPCVPFSLVAVIAPSLEPSFPSLPRTMPLLLQHRLFACPPIVRCSSRAVCAHRYITILRCVCRTLSPLLLPRCSPVSVNNT